MVVLASTMILGYYAHGTQTHTVLPDCSGMLVMKAEVQYKISFVATAVLLVGKPEGKRPLGRPRRRCVDNIRMDLGEVGWGDVDWIDLAKDRNTWRAFVNSVLNLRVP
jgi:hypothetical protein